MKRFFCVFFALALALACLPAWAEEAENLVRNGDFSRINNSGMPEDWEREMWHSDAGVSFLTVENNGYDGPCIAIENVDPNDARFAQTIEVEPDSLYRISCMVKAEGCGEDGYGASISFENCFSYSDLLMDTAGRWRELTVYGRTGPDQEELTFFLRVGGYGNLGSGKAWFDNVRAEKVDEAPEGAAVLALSTVAPSSNNSADEDLGEPRRNTEAYLLLACLYVLAMVAVARRSARIRAAKINANVLLAAGLLVALALRIAISAMVRGYNTDINCFTAWSERMFDVGPGAFYAPDYFCDYPPGYMLLLWPVAALRSLLGISTQSGAYYVLLKGLPVICDLLGALLIWRFGRKKNINPRICAVMALIYAFNPAAIIDSAAWGQIDSVLALLVTICALEAAEERYIPSLIAFSLAMLMKPQALLFAPLGLFAIVVNLARAKSMKKLRDFGIGLISALALLYLAGALCCGKMESAFTPVNWLYALYTGTLESYSYITVNALNLYQLLDMNWAETAAQPVWTSVAWAMFGLSYIYAGFLYAKSKKRQHILLTGGLLIALIYCFGPKIHERYIFPALLLLSLAYLCERDKRILASLTVMTAVAAMNEILVLQGGMTAANYGHLQSSERWLNAALSAVNMANALYLAYVSFDICVLGRVRRLAKPEAELPTVERDHRLHIRRIDCLLMAAVTLLYAGIAFMNLGSTSAPQTSWVSSKAGESISFDLGEIKTFRPIYYGGICNSAFTVELSNDGENWTEPVRAKYNQGEIFRWIYFVPLNSEDEIIRGEGSDPGDGSAYFRYVTDGENFPMQTARYFRISADSAGLTLSEFGFWGEDGSLLPVTIAQQSGVNAETMMDAGLLIDEQDTVAEVPSWYNSTYFDEIYHARTAYELQNGMSIYEYTHPHLGKLTMMLGIELFGMTPFGWRFMGALVGVLMVPLMYLLAKQLTKSTKLSFIAMCLMALDSMHFTQTRIATIDSYAVFWIMLEYLLMFRYFQMDWRKMKFWRTLVPLGLCGITMGLACATKWIGIYSAAGLALIFFWKLWIEFRRREKTGIYVRRFLLTGCFCLVFFIIIPLAIYYFSYYRHFLVDGITSFKEMFSREYVEKVVDLQERILDYHAGLGGDTHYFRSPWYQWPVIWWPMWYYSGADYVASNMVSSISCMGNPAVWWTGLVALVLILFYSVWKRRSPKAWLLVLIGFASQFLPWVLVPRSTFIYHYFASVPFIILCIALCLERLARQDEKAFKWLSAAIVVAALVLFAAFYPLESGVTVAKDYAKYLRWFKWYNY